MFASFHLGLRFSYIWSSVFSEFWKDFKPGFLIWVNTSLINDAFTAHHFKNCVKMWVAMLNSCCGLFFDLQRASCSRPERFSPGVSRCSDVNRSLKKDIVLQLITTQQCCCSSKITNPDLAVEISSWFNLNNCFLLSKQSRDGMCWKNIQGMHGHVMKTCIFRQQVCLGAPGNRIRLSSERQLSAKSTRF